MAAVRTSTVAAGVLALGAGMIAASAPASAARSSHHASATAVGSVVAGKPGREIRVHNPQLSANSRRLTAEVRWSAWLHRKPGADRFRLQLVGYTPGKHATVDVPVASGRVTSTNWITVSQRFSSRQAKRLAGVEVVLLSANQATKPASRHRTGLSTSAEVRGDHPPGSGNDCSHVEITPFANLRDCDLVGADLAGANLRRADLSGADLSRATLRGANLYRADLTGAILNDADLTNAKLTLATLRQARLGSAEAEHADLEHADLQSAWMPLVNLTAAKLADANLKDANLRRAELHRSALNEAKLPWANLEGADLTHALLHGADLSSANLERADLRWSNLIYVKWQGANLSFAIWTNGRVCEQFSIGECITKSLSARHGPK